MLEIRLLGGFDLSLSGRPLPAIRGQTGRSLFAYLVTYRQRPHMRAYLAELLWPNEPERQARRRLSQALWEVRQVVPDDYLHASHDSLQLAAGRPFWLDSAAFLEQRAVAADAPPAQAIGSLEKAADLYRGDFLAGHEEEWTIYERERLRTQLLDVLERLIRLHKGQGAYQRALHWANRLIRENSLYEEAYREAMRLCYLLDRPQEAGRLYRRLRDRLAQELDQDAAPPTTAFYREIQSGRRQVTGQEEPAGQEESGRLIGRQKERAQLVQALEETLRDQGSLILLEGEAGIGKTRLLEQAAADARWRGLDVLWISGEDGEELAPFASVRAALAGGLSPLRARQLALALPARWARPAFSLLPEQPAFSSSDPPAPDLPPDEERLPQALAQMFMALGDLRPHLLIFDDAHWLDDGTLETVARLAPQLPGRPLLLILAYRGAPARERQTLWERLQALDLVPGRRRIVLTRLGKAETAQLAQQELGAGGPSPPFATTLFRDSGGNPLFLLEAVRSRRDAGRLRQNAAGQWLSSRQVGAEQAAAGGAPAQLQDLIGGRLRRLPESARRLLQAAAVLGARFELSALLQASEMSEKDSLAALDVLLRRDLLTGAGDAYRFGHDLLRQAAYEAIPAGDRVHLHRRAAAALAGADDGSIYRLANHYAAGGIWPEAVRAMLAAARRAQAAHAYDAARTYCERALRILDERDPLPAPEAARLRFHLLYTRQYGHWVQGRYEARGADLEALEGAATTPAERIVALVTQADHLSVLDAYAEAAQRAREALEQARASGGPFLTAVALNQVAQAAQMQDRYAEAEEALEEAITLLEGLPEDAGHPAVPRENGVTLRADVQIRLVQVHVRRGRPEAAEPLCREVLATARLLGHDYREMLGHHYLAGLYYDRGAYREAIGAYEAGLDLAQKMGFPRREAVFRSNLGHVLWALRDYGAAIRQIRAGLDVYRELDDQRNLAVALDNLGHLYRETGLPEAAAAAFAEGSDVVAAINFPYASIMLACDQAQLFLEQGDPEAAGQKLETIRPEVDAIGAPYPRAIFYFVRGLWRRQGERPALAATAFETAERLFAGAGEEGWAVAARSFLGRARLEEGDEAAARALTAGAVAALKRLRGGEEVVAIHYNHWRVLAATGAEAEARAALETAHALVMEHRETLPDEGWQRDFLRNVPANRAIVDARRAAVEAETAGQEQVRLPAVDAPTGRPLEPADTVAVRWTVRAPEDDAVAGKGARRRHRIRRLVRQASAQGALPRVADLAATLDVSSRTIRRDLNRLRGAGHDVPTWGHRPGGDD